MKLSPSKACSAPNQRCSTDYYPDRWGVILAGGDGTRLRPLTRKLAGDDRPKQFCPIIGSETLLDLTRRRIGLSIAPDKTMFLLNRQHEPFYRPLLDGVSSDLLVVQPENRGTSPAIFYSLFRLAAMAPMDSVAFFPSDHFVSDDRIFMDHVERAFAAVRVRPELLILLGIAPETPEVEYGWIEPGSAIQSWDASDLFRVHRFWEKPAPVLAQTLLARGCLWNSFIMIGSVSRFLALIRDALPSLYRSFAGLKSALETSHESEAIQRLYSRLRSMNFSDQVLVPRGHELGLLPVSGVRWSDLGEPNRVLSSLTWHNAQTDWAEAGGLRVA